uniref:Uncharacterized protein n=1 Tax=Anguilla anguilla TaxID=7936 RepID=A0A0E9WKY9_ANGAN
MLQGSARGANLGEGVMVLSKVQSVRVRGSCWSCAVLYSVVEHLGEPCVFSLRSRGVASRPHSLVAVATAPIAVAT